MSAIRTLTSWVRSHPITSLAVATGAIGVGAYLAFGVFGFHLLFVDQTVAEADPFAAGRRPSAVDGDPSPPQRSAPVDDAAAQADPASGGAPAGTAGATATARAERRVLASGEFIDRSHLTSGRVAVVTDGTRRVLRIEQLRTDNGPDLNVYLVAAPPDADSGGLVADVVDLGDLKGNIGDQNYDIPDHVDLDRYSTVVIWCVRFSVAFGAAALS